MAQYAWATDTHLDCLGDDNQRLLAFAESLIRDNPTGIFLTGDISNARDVVYKLSVIERVVQRPIYFVLGNHDYYGGEIDKVRQVMKELSNMSPFLKYMPTMPYYALSTSSAVVGHDGWYDAYNGDWKNSKFVMNDWYMIHDFMPVANAPGSIVALSRRLAHDAVKHVHDGIKQAVRYYKNIVILTHYPPFAESHIYNGSVGDDHAQPWFTSRMMGDMLLDAAKAFPTHSFFVLAGHTHGAYSGRHAPNLEVHVGGAEYNKPQLQRLIEVM